VLLYGTYELPEDLIVLVLENAMYKDIVHFTKLLRRNTLTESMLAYITLNILKGLKHMNNCGFVHFDIKPQNILVDEHLTFKLADFSVSEEMKKGKKEYNLPFVGTLYYMAPEIFDQKIVEADHLHKVDLWSLGVMIYQLAFGKLPFDINFGDRKEEIHFKNKSE